MKHLSLILAVLLIGCTSAPVKTSRSEDPIRKVASTDDDAQANKEPLLSNDDGISCVLGFSIPVKGKKYPEDHYYFFNVSIGEILASKSIISGTLPGFHDYKQYVLVKSFGDNDGIEFSYYDYGPNNYPEVQVDRERPLVPYKKWLTGTAWFLHRNAKGSQRSLDCEFKNAEGLLKDKKGPEHRVNPAR